MRGEDGEMGNEEKRGEEKIRVKMGSEERKRKRKQKNSKEYRVEE